MFGFFRKKEKVKQPPVLLDIEGMEILNGDTVEVLRYEIGMAVVVLEGLQYFYVSNATGEKVSYVKMIDASTQQQKVRKV